MSGYVGGQKGLLCKGDLHPASWYRGSNLIAGYKLLEQTGTSLAFADTYNDTVQGLTVFGKSEQVQTTANNNLCSSFNYNKWVLVNGAYLQDGWIYLPNSNSYAYIDIPWWQKASYFYCRLTVQSDYYNTGTAWAHIQTEYRLNGTALSANGYAVIIDAVTDQRKSAQFGSPSNPDAYGQAIAQADTIRFIVKRSTDYARQPYRFKDVYVSTVYINLTDTHLVFVPNSPSPDYPSPITNVTGNLNITDGTDIKQTLALADLNGIAGVYDTFEPYVLVDGVVRRRKTQRIGKKVLDGATAGAKFDYKNADDGDYKSFYINNATIGRLQSPSRVICSHFTSVAWDPPPSGNYWWWAIPSTGMRIHKSYLTNYDNLTTDADRIAAANAWLAAQNAAGTPVTVYYVLATPVPTLGDPVTILTYPGHTHLDAGGAELTATCRVVDL